jgi:hypothetical protein
MKRAWRMEDEFRSFVVKLKELREGNFCTCVTCFRHRTRLVSKGGVDELPRGLPGIIASTGNRCAVTTPRLSLGTRK